MAHIRKLPSGRWNAVVRHPSGRRITKTDPLKRVVVLWAQQTEAAFRRGGLVPRRDTFGDWCDQWLAARAVEASTARKDESRLRLHIRPQWDSWPLVSIGRMDVQQWVNALYADGVGAPTARGSYQLMATIMAEAVREGLVQATPCYRVKLPRVAKPAPRWLTRHEYDRIQFALATRTIMAGGRVPVPDLHAPVWQALVGLACHSGLRPAELAGLDVSAVDLDRRLVRVSQVLTRQGLRAYGKSDRATRSVPFPAEVGQMLWRVIADKRPTDPVFTAPRGGRLQFEGNFRSYVWVPTLEAAGIAPVRFYVCRHTAASWLVQAGVPDRQIMALLGHADAHLVATYAHLAPDAHDEIRAAWGDSWPTADTRLTVTHEGEPLKPWSGTGETVNERR